MSSSEDRDNHGIIRSDFPGGWAGDEVNAFTGKGLTYEQQDVQEYTKTLLNWRQTSEAVHKGKLMHFSPEDGIYVYFRYTDSDKVMVILNKNEESKDLPLERFDEMLGGHESAKDIFSGTTYVLGQKLNIPRKAAMILELD